MCNSPPSLRRAGFSGKSNRHSRRGSGARSTASSRTSGVCFLRQIAALRGDNTCAGCHSPTAGFGDTQSIAIGIQNNNIVGPNRPAQPAPHADRRQHGVLPKPDVEWAISSAAGDPFDNSRDSSSRRRKGSRCFPPHDPVISTLLAAQGHLPPTELVEVAGFTGTAGTIDPRLDQFDDGLGEPVPPADASGFRNEPIRQALLVRLNASPAL